MEITCRVFIYSFIYLNKTISQLNPTESLSGEEVEAVLIPLHSYVVVPNFNILITYRVFYLYRIMTLKNTISPLNPIISPSGKGLAVVNHFSLHPYVGESCYTNFQVSIAKFFKIYFPIFRATRNCLWSCSRTQFLSFTYSI